MKAGKTTRYLVALLAGMLCAGSAFAGARVMLGFHIGVPLYWPSPYSYYYAPYYYPAPYYAYPPPTVYVQPPYAESRAPAPAEQAYSWYYCGDAKAYYPYVRDCPGGWQRVSPVPPAP